MKLEYIVTKFKLISAAMVGVCLLGASPVVQAAPVNGNALLAVQNSQAAPLTEVRYRGRHWRRHHYRHHHSNGGAVAAGAIIGLAAGAIAANAAAGNNAVAYCSQRFRSYDPRSGTYLGYDGYRHPCP
jgi:hypothetical protein